MDVKGGDTDKWRGFGHRIEVARENVYLWWSNCCTAFLAVQSFRLLCQKMLPTTSNATKATRQKSWCDVWFVFSMTVVAVEPVFQSFFNTSHSLIATYTTDLLPLNVPGWWGSRLVTNGAFAAKAPYNLASVTTSLKIILLKAWWYASSNFTPQLFAICFFPLCFNCLAKLFCHFVDKSEAILLL